MDNDSQLALIRAMGIWFAVFPNWESMLAQLLAAAFVIGSFVLARTAKLSSAN